jgi:hypothetical protein
MALTAYGSFQDALDSGASKFSVLQPILKEYYGPQQIKNLVYKRNKWLAMVHKEEDWSGLVVPIPVIYGNPQGGSATFSNLVSSGSGTNQVTGSSAIRFVMQWTQDYALAVISNLVNLASRNDAGAFLKAVQNELNGALRTAENRLAGGMFRSNTGTIGASAAAVSTGVITLSDPMSVTQFEVGQKLEASNTDGGAGLGGPDFGYVIAVNRSTSKITVSTTPGGAAGNPTGWTGGAAWFYRVAGDRNLKLYGLADWLPQTDPTGGESFNGVDRSKDRTRLAGIYWDGSGQTIEEAFIDAAALVAREDGNPELALTNHTSYAALEKALGSKVNYVNYEHAEAQVGFQGIRVHGADSEINLFADRNCPGKTSYLIDPDSFTLGSMKPCPHILTELDGLTELRDPNADAMQIRIGSYAILACNAPGKNAVLKLQA